ncbi:MAG: solute carrier family 23 protein [Candidatus Acidiferrales bacterium]
MFQRSAGALDRFFHYHERGSTFWTEVIGGITTFSTLSYVLVVHPLILSEAGMDRGALISVTALAAAIFTVIMGLRTNYPLAMAPGMGVNAYIAVQVCQGMHIPWQAALGMVFYSGLLFLLISVTGIRRKIIDSFPGSFKRTVSAGIGMFIAFIGLKNAGIIVANPHSIVSLGDFSSAQVLLGFAGIVFTIVLVNRGVRGALILSILLITAAGIFLPGAGAIPGARITPLPPDFRLASFHCANVSEAGLALPFAPSRPEHSYYFRYSFLRPFFRDGSSDGHRHTRSAER